MDSSKPSTDTLWYTNPKAREWTTETNSSAQVIHAFHQSLLPDYQATQLVELPSLAKELGVARVFMKDESTRLGLPAFKILGASWGVFYTLCQRWKLDIKTTKIDELKKHAQEEAGGPIELCAATAGNHGRAVAHMAKLLGVTSTIYVPQATSPRSQHYIESEGAHVYVVPGSYEMAVEAARKSVSDRDDKLVLIQDVAWPGYEDLPLRIVDGYTTLFQEVDQQLSKVKSPPASLVACPVGCGPLAHAAVKHFRSESRQNPPKMLTVEPFEAACLLKSLAAGELIEIEAKHNIMPGLTGSKISFRSWPDLQAGVDAAIAVTDADVDKAVHDLKGLQVSSGPCGASTVAAVRSLATLSKSDDTFQNYLQPEDVVVLISTEGNQTYLGE
jgi:diaminopropionate ammonia-lyase